MWLKRIASICFALAFLMAIVVFTRYGRDLIDSGAARILFLTFGATGLILNLISFRYGRQDPGFNFVFWLGSIILFIGLVFMLMHWPFGFYILIAGMITLGLSFFIPAGISNEDDKKDDILDDHI